MEEDDEGVALDEGMPVTNPEGAALGTLGALLVEEEEDDAEFIILRTGDVERLVPFEAVLGVGDGALVLDVPEENVARFPVIQRDAEPTPDQMEQAYEVFDEGASEDEEV